MPRATSAERRESVYAEVTKRVIAELEAGRLPWVQPWDNAACGCAMPANAATGRAYSGIRVLILWSTIIERGFGSQRWLTFRQAIGAGGNVRKGETGTTVCYADRFTPEQEKARARDENREARQIAFLKRFTVFNVDQCEGLPEAMTAAPVLRGECETIPEAEALILGTGADFRIGGNMAYYSPATDHVQVPPKQAARRVDDMREQRRSDAASQMIRMRAHGLDLAGPVAEHLERADPDDKVAVPERPQCHAGRPQSGKIKREDRPRRRAGAHAVEMNGQEIAGGRAGQVVFDDFEHRSSVRPARRSSRERPRLHPRCRQSCSLPGDRI